MSATAGATYSIYVGDTSKIPVRLTGNATIASNNQGNNLPSTNSAACVLTYSASFSIGQRQVVIQFENARSAREKRQSFEWPWIQINQIRYALIPFSYALLMNDAVADFYVTLRQCLLWQRYSFIGKIHRGNGRASQQYCITVYNCFAWYSAA